MNVNCNVRRRGGTFSSPLPFVSFGSSFFLSFSVPPTPLDLSPPNCFRSPQEKSPPRPEMQEGKGISKYQNRAMNSGPERMGKFVCAWKREREVGEGKGSLCLSWDVCEGVLLWVGTARC